MLGVSDQVFLALKALFGGSLAVLFDSGGAAIHTDIHNSLPETMQALLWFCGLAALSRNKEMGQFCPI